MFALDNEAVKIRYTVGTRDVAREVPLNVIQGQWGIPAFNHHGDLRSGTYRAAGG